MKSLLRTLLLAPWVGAWGCNSTAGQVIDQLPVSIGGAPQARSGSLSFSTNYFGPSGCGDSVAGSVCGWRVELDEAVINVGPFYFYQSPPSTQGTESGPVLVQVLSQQFVNALDPTLYPVPGGSGETGAIRSVQVGLFPAGCNGFESTDPSGNDACGVDQRQQQTYTNLIAANAPANLGAVSFSGMPLPYYLGSGSSLETGSSAFVAGTATAMLVLQPDGGDLPNGVPFDPTSGPDGGLIVVPFFGFITIDKSTGVNAADQAAAPLTSLQQVAGACPCAGGCEVDGGCVLEVGSPAAQLQIRVDPSHWFDGVDFARLIPTTLADGGAAITSPAGWVADAGALTWNTGALGNGVDSFFNTELVQEGLQQAEGVYLFNVVTAGGS